MATLDLVLLILAFLLLLLQAFNVPGPRGTSLGWFGLAALVLTMLTP